MLTDLQEAKIREEVEVWYKDYLGKPSVGQIADFFLSRFREMEGEVNSSEIPNSSKEERSECPQNCPLYGFNGECPHTIMNAPQSKEVSSCCGAELREVEGRGLTDACCKCGKIFIPSQEKECCNKCNPDIHGMENYCHNLTCSCHISNQDREELTNGGKPHICGTIQIHNNRLNESLWLCGKCNMPVGNKEKECSHPYIENNMMPDTCRDCGKVLKEEPCFDCDHGNCGRHGGVDDNKEPWWVSELEKIEQNAKTLQKTHCCYGTEEGDSRTCDCKFLGEDSRWKIGSEQTGCCEAREILWELKKLKSFIRSVEKRTKADILRKIENMKGMYMDERINLTIEQVIANLKHHE